MIQARTQFVEVRHLAVLGEVLLLGECAVLGLPVLADGFLVEVVPESLYPFGRDLTKCHLLIRHEDFEVLEAAVPITPISAALLRTQTVGTHLTEIIEEDDILLERLFKSKAVVLELDNPLAPDRFRECEGVPVRLLVFLCPFGYEVKLQEFVRPDTVDVDVKE